MALGQRSVGSKVESYSLCEECATKMANPQMPPPPAVRGDELCLLPGQWAVRDTAIRHRERDAEANWHLGQCRAPSGLRAEPPAHWHQGKSFFLLVQLFCMDFAAHLPVSFTGEVLTHALGSVCSQDSLLMAFLEKGWAEETGRVQSQGLH